MKNNLYDNNITFGSTTYADIVEKAKCTVESLLLLNGIDRDLMFQISQDFVNSMMNKHI